MLVLVNREFITDDAEFQADARGVAEVDVRVSGQTTEGQEWFADGASRATAQSERRVANIRNLSSAELRQLEQAFTRPLALERVNLVDPQLITRLQQLEDSERRMPSARGQMDNVETQAYVNHADWVVELLAHRTPPGDPQEFSVRARVIDLQSGRVLVSLISDPLVAPIYIPGTRGIPPRVPLGESARAVAGALISELPLAAP